MTTTGVLSRSAVRRHRPIHHGRARRRRTAWAVALTGALCGSVLAAAWPDRLSHHQPRVCTNDAVQARAVGGLAQFAGWLRREHATGFVGEVGWPADPDGPQWTAVAEAWYRAADRLGLPVTAWAAAPWPADYPMAAYRTGATAADPDTAGPQAAVVERHPGPTRGVVLAAGSFGTGGGYSSARPGRAGFGYRYEDAAVYRFLAGRGIRLIRLAVTWERLQDRPFGPLVADEVARLRTAVDQADEAGLRVIVDLHNYGDYALGTPGGAVRRLPLGSAELPTAALADLWGRLAAATADLPALAGYGLLNEPTKVAGSGRSAALVWERAAQQAVDAVRANGGTAAVLVSGYARMAPADWGRLHPHAWLADPLHRVAYEAHQYFDQDNSGHYALGYAAELARSQATAPARCQALTALPAGPLATGRRS